MIYCQSFIDVACMKAVNEAQFELEHHQSLLLQSQQTWAKRFDRFDFISDLAAHWVIIVVHTHTTVSRPLVRDYPGRPVPEETFTHSNPILIIRHPLSSSSIYYDPQHPLYSVYVLDSPFRQPLPRSSLVFLLVLDALLHAPCISSSSRHLFAAHAHTIAACSAAIPVLCLV